MPDLHSTGDFAGRRAIIVGGSRGIGLAIARHFRDRGAEVGLVARDAARLAEAQSELAAPGLSPVRIAAADIRDRASVDAAIGGLIDTWGGVEVLVSTAAIPADRIKRLPVEDFDETDLQDQLDTKLFGFLRAIRAVVPAMKTAGYGRIINIGGQSAYQTGSLSATVRNVALQALTTNLADELGPSGITVNLVHPGFTITERTPEIAAGIAARDGIAPVEALRRIAVQNRSHRLNTADDIAEVIGFLASSAGAAINGESLYAGAGLRGRN